MKIEIMFLVELGKKKILCSNRESVDDVVFVFISENDFSLSDSKLFHFQMGELQFMTEGDSTFIPLLEDKEEIDSIKITRLMVQ